MRTKPEIATIYNNMIESLTVSITVTEGSVRGDRAREPNLKSNIKKNIYFEFRSDRAQCERLARMSALYIPIFGR